MSGKVKKNMCTNKRRYETWEAAKWFSRFGLMRVYKCPFCNGFHVTGNSKRKNAWVKK